MAANIEAILLDFKNLTTSWTRRTGKAEKVAATDKMLKNCLEGLRSLKSLESMYKSSHRVNLDLLMIVKEQAEQISELEDEKELLEEQLTYLTVQELSSEESDITNDDDIHKLVWLPKPATFFVRSADENDPDWKDITEKVNRLIISDRTLRCNEVVCKEKALIVRSSDKNFYSNIKSKLENIGIVIEPERKFDPVICIYAAPKEIDLLKEISERNGLDIDKLRILSTTPNKYSVDKLDYVVRLSKEERKKLEPDDHIYFSDCGLKFSDQIKPRFCSKCLSYGHNRKHCSQQIEICWKCGDEHNHETCNEEKWKQICLACKKSNIDCNFKHKRSECLLYKRAVKKLKERIDYDYD